jgi:hypothetical protein
MNMIQRGIALASGLVLAGAAYANDAAPVKTTEAAPVVKTAKKHKDFRKECLAQHPGLKGDKTGLKACIAEKKKEG